MRMCGNRHSVIRRRKTGLKEGGDSYLFAITLADGQKVWIVTKKLNAWYLNLNR